MSRAQEHVAQANRYIAELTVEIIRQRVIVKYALDTGQSSELSESLLHALEESLGTFEKYRELILEQMDRPQGSRQAPRPAGAGLPDGRDYAGGRS